jgi:hypothetical protein
VKVEAQELLSGSADDVFHKVLKLENIVQEFSTHLLESVSAYQAIKKKKYCV